MIRTTTDLRDWRAAKGWSQQEAADALGYKLRGYIELERRKDGTIPSRVGLTIMGSDIASRTVARSLHGLTNGDLSDEDNIRQADHELKRATNDAQLADWARRWGECAIERLHAVVTVEEEAQADAQEDIEAAAEGAACEIEREKGELEREKGDLEDKYFALRKAADAVFSALPMQPTDAELNALEALL